MTRKKRIEGIEEDIVWMICAISKNSTLRSKIIDRVLENAAAIEKINKYYPPEMFNEIDPEELEA